MLLFNVPFIRPGFFGSLRLLEGRLVRCRRAPLVLVLQNQSPTSSPSGQPGKKRKSRKGKAPFSSSSGGSGRSGGKGKGAGKKSAWREVSPVESRGLPRSALETVAGNRSGVLGRDHSTGRLPFSLHGLSSSPFSHPSIVSDVPGRLSWGSSLAARGRGDAFFFFLFSFL